MFSFAIWTCGVSMKFLQPKYLFLLLCFTLLISICTKDFYSRGEAREALVAQSMFLSKNYILPESYNGAIPSKPPLLHWAIVGIGSLFGSVDEWTSRFPSAAAAFLFCIYLYCFLRERFSNEHAFFSVIALATSFEWYRAATTARVDMIFSVCLAVSLLLWLDWWERAKKEAPAFCLLFLVAAVLAKGPVALILFFVITTSFIGIHTRSIVSIGRTVFPFLFFAIWGAALWYYIAWEHGQDKFLNKFLYENVDRFASTMDDEPHKHSVFYLYGMFFLGLLPWSGIVLLPVVNALRRKKVGTLAAMQPLQLFSTIVMVVIVLFFSIPSSKRGVYLLPAFPFVFILLSYVVHQKDRLLKVGFAISLAYLAGDGLIAPYFVNDLSYRSFADETRADTASENVLYSYDDEFYGFSFYLKKPFRSILSGSDLEQGYVYMFENNLDLFKQLMSHKKVSVVKRSSRNVVKPGKHVLLVRVEA